MAGNPTPEDSADLVALTEDIADGLHNHEVAVGVKQNIETVVRAVLTAYGGAELAQGAAKLAKANAETAVQIADSNAKAWLGAARKVLANHLGNSWNPAWEPTGFPDQSTAVPAKQEKRLKLCGDLKNYFTANPGHTLAAWDVTAAKADEFHEALSDAREDRGTKESDFTDAQKALQLAYTNLRKRVSGLISELGTLLADDDSRWHAFGLSMPSDPATPEAVEEVTLTAGTPGVVLPSWSRAPRATRYRVFGKVLTVDPEFVALATVHDFSTTLENLPSGQTLQIYIVAANDDGEAAPSPTREIVIP